MKQITDHIAVSLIGIIILILFEGIATFGDAFKFESYNWFGWAIQIILLYIAVWIANKVYD